MEEYRNHPSPRVDVNIPGEGEFSFNYRNTLLIGFENCYADDEYDYSHMNNIVHVEEDGTEIKIYHSEEVYRRLAQLAFSRILKPYPDEDDIEDYAQFFEAQMNNEVRGTDGFEFFEDGNFFEDDD